MLETVAAVWGQLEAWLFALASSVWALPALFASTAADGLFPPVPGETMLILLAVPALSGHGLPVAAVVGVAAFGAWCGDQAAFALGRAVETRRVPFCSGARRSAADWAARSLQRRGAAVVLAARFVPVGRTAVNVGAGAMGFSRRRFAALSAVASATWAGYYLAISALAGQWLGDRPLLAVVVGVAGGTLLGLAIDRGVRAAAVRRPRAVPTAAQEAPKAGTTGVVSALGERSAGCSAPVR